MKRLAAVMVVLLSACWAAPADAAEVVAFWGFTDDYEFTDNPNKQDFAADVDATVSGDASLQAYLGDADELDDNGGGGFVSYTSPVSGVAYGPTRTLKFDDIKGGGDDFDIAGVTSFLVDKNDGAGAQSDDFGNDGLLYLTLDGTGYADFQIRFDIEGDPADLPSTFDIFYRVDGAGGTWFRDADQNNLPLAFFDYDPVDPENQYADSGYLSLSPQLDGASSIEILLTDFVEFGNGEVEFDNIEIVAAAVPSPAAAGLLIMAGVGALAGRSRRRCRR